MVDRDLSGRTFGEFLLLEQIGRGGYASVYRAEQPSLKRHVVVKVLRKTDDNAEQRFLREAQVASRFDHPYAAHVYAFGVATDVEGDRVLWIAMELVQGTTLHDWLEQHGPMPLATFVPFFESIAEAVHAAHECEIVHRDLTPVNVMVIERGSRLLPKVIDFGIAKADLEPSGPDGDAPSADAVVTAPIRVTPESGPRTVTSPAGRGEKYRITRVGGGGFGTRQYMSPEQWTDARSVGPASDVYSLGIVAFEALTGRLPYTAKSVDEYYELHRSAEVPSLGPGFSNDFDRVIRCALAKHPGHRYRSVLEMAAELREALEAQPREQLRSLAKVWNDRERSSALLLPGGELLNTPTEAIGDLERAYVTASQRLATRRARIWRAMGVSAAVLALGAVWYRGVLETRAAQTRAAQQVAEATITQAELEQGRSALLHGEPEAQGHLAEAYRHDHSPSTAFMLARALQPRLAEQARLPSSFGRMWSASFSPDGAQIVTTDDKNAQIWDAQTYRLLFTLPHGDVVYQAVYSADGKRLVTAAGDGAVRMWDAANGTLTRELRRDGAKLRYVLLALSPDSKLVVAMDLGVAHVWEASTGAPLAELRDDASSGSPSLTFSADGHWLAMGAGNDVRVFHAGTWAQVLTIPGPGIDGLSWDPNGSRLLTGSTEGDTSIWAIPSGHRVHHLRDSGEPVDAVAFSPDGRLVVAASRDGGEQIWNATSGKRQSQGNYLRSKIRSVEFDSTSTLVVAAGTSGAIAVANVAEGMPVSVLDGPRNVVMVAHFDRSSQWVVGASWDGTARVWNAASPYHRWSSLPVSDDCGLVASLEPDRRFLAIGCKNYPTHVWDTAHDHLVAELPSVTPVDGDFASAFPAVSTAGDRAAIARGNTVEVYDLPGGRLLRTILHGAPVNTVAFATAGRDVVSGAVDGSLLVTRDNGAVLALPASSGGIDAAGFLPDGRVVAADSRRRLRVYDPAGTVLTDLETMARVRTLRMSLDSRRLITIPGFMGKAASPELWDLALPSQNSGKDEGRLPVPRNRCTVDRLAS